MQFSEHGTDGAIEAYREGCLTLGGTDYTGTVVIGAGVRPCPDMPPAGQMRPEHFQAAVEGGAEIILVGTGAKQQFVPPQTAAALSARGIALESMSTAAACRTFSLLQSEGRRVWAWLRL